MLSNYISYILLLSSLVSALPVFQNKKVVTRVHTASTTNTVTDFYSTTTEVVVAPTVEFIISGDATFTTTLYPEGVDSTVQPSTTITIRQNNVANPTLATTAPSSIETTSSTVLEPSTSSTTILEPSTSSTILEPSTSTTSSTTQTRVAAVTITNQGQTTTTLIPILTDIVNNEHTSAAPGVSSSSYALDQQSTFTSTSTSTSASSTASSSSLLTKVPGALVYSPYNNDGSCKTYLEVYDDISIIYARGVRKLRVYGTDCNSLETVEPVCAQFGMTVNQGLWISSAGVDSIDDAITSLINYGQTNGWSVFDFITVGNEAIISGYCTVDELISKISSVKSQLQAAGYTGQITTSEPPVSYENNPELCTSSEIDFVGINPHSYFDTYSTAETSGSFVKGQVELIKNTCGTSNVYVTETGYPSAGIQNGGNIPSTANQLIAVQSILDELDSDVTILTYTNDYWKDAGAYGIEQSFGIIDILP